MHSLSPNQKRKSRIIALQIIYANELKGSNVDETCKFILDFHQTSKNKIVQYSKHLCNLTYNHKKDVDDLIKEYSRNWDFNRIAIMDRLIMRLSLAEMLFEKEVPPKVSITEGVEISKKFSTSDSSSFINGILDAVYNKRIKEESI